MRLCPQCRFPLYEVRYNDSKVIIDICNVCHGTWLDRGEFKKIIEYLKKQANWRVLNRYIKTLSEEFWEIFSGPESLKDETLDFLALLKILSYKWASQHPALTRLISDLPR